ncbi:MULTISPECIES: ABC transporter ATP-binding protein [Roseobacteraceae]|jgi:putative hydroxymethylpyrimidine transport system ATP-binding protein|uniref:Aliphatic sulfonates import ATP-binding protein SsuB n=1 Tax=Pseudosulfitobacter pseudonitzschiae TaxID=1402135 RepID=A0A221K714_9RHOB|nr:MULTISPECIES: ABC transporter ATP-binding protein [Roseobacteraceae]ASM74660.1 aliphatic sulfonates import ATP-binding protein SsuB [Pseudosulfitobacter pseudonitzschiae]
MTAPFGIRVAGQHRINGHLLFDADITLPAGRWTCLLGRSGVGKSTVLRLIPGLETGGRFTGTVTATDGKPLQGRISYMAQSDLLLPWLSALENVLIGARLRGAQADVARARRLLDRVGLLSHADKRPHMLSGGMRQRTALARTLFENRPLVLLDEPFSALDAGTRADMQELAAEVLQGRTVLLVTHDPSEATRLADQIIVMTARQTSIWPVPDTPALRAIDDPRTFDCQTRLLAHLRAAA